MPKLGLIFPRFRYPSGDYPLGLALLGAVVRRELSWQVALCDTTFDPRLGHVAEFLDRERPDVVGIGLSTLMLGEALQVARLAADRGIPVVAGGPHATTEPEELLRHPAISAAVIGEGERPLLALLPMLAEGRAAPVPGAWVKGRDGTVWPATGRDPWPDLDDLPLPAWDLVDMPTYLSAWGQLDSVRPGLRGVNVSGARGCPFSCTFCQPVLDAMFGKKLRQRSPRSLVEEIGALKDRYDIEGFWFTDDTFTTNRHWVEGFCDTLEDSGLRLLWGCTTRANLIKPELLRRMHSVGLRKLGIGLESATQRVREGIYGKGVSAEAVAQTVTHAHEIGVQTLLFLMLGAPDESRREMIATIEAATRLPASEASFSLFVPIPGTDVHRQMVAAGYDLSRDVTDYDYYARQPFTGAVDRRELRMLQRWAYLRFYSHPLRWRSLARTAGSRAGMRSLGRKLRRIAPGSGGGA
ncbi:B12-binding domain-containing radical SAM protein [Myxococcota bacterium]|nr:B12-binding domain-containing radical SAM protein [Myxococcota bacterium]